MTTPILVSLFVALAAGAATGFRRAWKASLLLASLGVPLAASLILQEPPWLLFREALLKLLWSMLVAALAWGLAAGLHHAASRLDGDAGEQAGASRAARFLGWGSSAIVAVAVPTAAAALFSQWAVDGLGARDMGLALFFAFLAALTGMVSLYAAPVLTLAGLAALYFRRGTGLRFLAAGAVCGIPIAVLTLLGR